MDSTQANESLRELTPSNHQDSRFVLDGTNILLLHGRNNPELRYVLALADYFHKKDRDFVCFFDANTHHLLQTQSSDQAERYSRLIEDAASTGRFVAVPSGTEADESILAEAKRCRGLVISNDKFRDRAKRNVWIWKRRHPVVAGATWLAIPSLDIEIQLLESAGDYFF